MKMNRYLNLSRVSGDKQEVKTQVSECLKRARIEENGAEFEFKSFEEGDVSSSIPYKKRTILQDFLRSLRQGNIVIVYELSRLARDNIEMVMIWREIKAKGCRIISVLEPWAEDEMVVGIIGSVAQQERKRLKERICANLNQKRERGERISRFLPYGYKGLDEENLIPVKNQKGDLVPGILVPCPQEQQVIEVIRSLAQSGCSLREVTNQLTDLGIKNRQGKKFHHYTVRRILSRLGTEVKDSELQEHQEDLSFQRYQ
jgi:DNA invertase Pin-like site-specific DNA recombinase